MPLTTAEIVRQRLNDPWRYGEQVLYGDGLRDTFQLAQGAPYSVIVTGSAFVSPGNTAWSATGATFNTALGTLAFSGVITANSAIRATYLWAVFGDGEIEYFTGHGGIIQATIAGIDMLMGNAWRRARWAAPDGSTYDDTKALDNLVRWRSALRASLVDDIGPEGNWESWAASQEEFS